MQIYQTGPDLSLLQHSIASTNPVEFVLMEELLLRLTIDRAPVWSPRLILSPGGWRKYRQGQESIRLVEEMIHQSWLTMVQMVLTARADLVQWSVDEKRRQLQWAEDLRRMRDAQDLQLDYQLKTAEIQDRLAKLADRRTLTRELSVAKINHIYAKEMAALQMNQNDPAHRAARYQAALELIKPELDAIAASAHTSAVKNQLSRAYLDALKLILQ